MGNNKAFDKWSVSINVVAVLVTSLFTLPSSGTHTDPSLSGCQFPPPTLQPLSVISQSSCSVSLAESCCTGFTQQTRKGEKMQRREALENFSPACCYCLCSLNPWLSINLLTLLSQMWTSGHLSSSIPEPTSMPKTRGLTLVRNSKWPHNGGQSMVSVLVLCKYLLSNLIHHQLQMHHYFMYL